MSTLKTTNLQHPSAASPNLVLAPDGSVSGGAGLGGLVLVSPTSIANSGGSASASGGAVTATGVTTVSLNGVFTSAYQNYRLVVSGIGSLSSLNDLWFRVRASGTDLSGSVYVNGSTYVTQVGGPTRSYSNNSTLFYCGYVGDLYNAIVIDLMNPAQTVATGIVNTYAAYNNSNTTFIQSIGGGNVNNTTAYNGITFGVNSNNWTGTIRVYGYKNS